MTTILTYHHIGDPPPGAKDPHLFVSVESFAAQLNHLKKSGYCTASLDGLRARFHGADPAASPGREVIITFDDGYADNYENAFPLLQRHGFRAAFFITTGRIGGVDDRGYRYMTPDHLRELDLSGMTVGSHTVTHPWLARITADEARWELTESKEILEEWLGHPIRWLCYPSGSFSHEIMHMARELGYAGACSVIRDNRVAPEQLYFLPRVMVNRDTSLLRFRYAFSSFYHLLHARKNRKRWKKYLQIL